MEPRVMAVWVAMIILVTLSGSSLMVLGIFLERLQRQAQAEGVTVWSAIENVVLIPKAKRAYGWSHAEGDHNNGECFVIVLEIPPVNSP